jgi:hypothetical protein
LVSFLHQENKKFLTQAPDRLQGLATWQSVLSGVRSYLGCFSGISNYLIVILFYPRWLKKK